MDTEQILNHYRDPEFVEFYKTFFGEKFMNIGIDDPLIKKSLLV